MALGVTVDGHKQVLGLWHGATENSTVAKALLEDLMKRGLDPNRPMLFVIDGSKALRKAIREVFGASAPVQRCRVHKQRNIVEHLPKNKQQQAIWRLRTAWEKSNPQEAEAELREIVGWLEGISPSAARSLEEAAAIRGVSLSSGAKALICKGEEKFVMFVIPANRKLASKQVRRLHGWRKFRFAKRDEVLSLTGLTPGSIPPFGSVFGLPTYCDETLGENAKINFNAGDHTISINMHIRDYLAAERPEVGAYAEVR